MTDAELRRNSGGQIVVPGTAIAGTVRRTLERLAGVDAGENRCQLYRSATSTEPCECSVCAFMGDVSPGTGRPDARRPRESKVYFFDALVIEPKTRVVDSVGIDRQRRAASDARKFDYAQVLPGAAVNIEVRAHDLSDQQYQWLGAALRLLATGKVLVGGRTSRGHGVLEASAPTDCKIFARNIANVDQLLFSITHAADAREGWRVKADSLDKFPRAAFPAQVTLRFTLCTDERSSLLIADPVAAARSGFDRAMRQLDRSPELPVPSLVGALRGGAERIVRTIASNVPLPTGTVHNPACDLFSNDRCQPPKDESGNATVVNDAWCCLICRVFGNQDWASRLSATAHLDGDAFHELHLDHVAIDRFTGGASDQKKFDALAVRKVKFKVTLNLDVVNEAQEDRWKIGLLALVLRDLNDGRITLGHGAAKGHGFVRVENVHWQPPRGWEREVENLQDCVNSLWEKVRHPNPAPSTDKENKANE